MFQIESNPLPINSEEVFRIGDFVITNSIMGAFLNLMFFLLLIYLVSKFKIATPSKIQSFIELIFLGIVGFIEQVAGDRKIAFRIAPLVTTLILFILISNIINTFLPFIGAITYNGVQVFRSHTNDFNTTLALAFLMILLVQAISIKKIGIVRYILNFFQIDQIILGFAKGIKTGLLSLINAFIGLLDIVSEISKVISLSLRLFGNMFAGEVLLGIFMKIFAIIIPIPIIGLGLLVGSVQSIVFGALVTAYLTNVLKQQKT